MATKIRTKDLEGGALTPGLSKYYGTDGSGNKGFFTFPGIATNFNTRENFIYGEDMSPATMAFFGKGITNTKLFESYQSGGANAFGNGVNVRFQRGFYVSKQTVLRNVQVYLTKTAAPTDNLNMYVIDASDRTTVIATSTTTLAGTGTISGLQTFTFNDVALTDDTYYLFEIRRDGAQSGTNYYNLHSVTHTDYQAYGSLWYYNGSVWALYNETTPRYKIQFGTNFTLDRLYKCDSRWAGTSIADGITEDTKTAGNSGALTLMGTNNTFTGLLAKRAYQINNEIVGQYNSNYNTTQVFGYQTTDREKMAQSFQLGREISVDRIILGLFRQGSPTDNVVVTIETDDGNNNPSGSQVHANAIATIPYYDITSGGNYSENVPYAFGGAFTLAADTKYWIVIKRSGALHTSNYYISRINSSTPYYYYGQLATYASSVWTKSDTSKLWFMFTPGVDFRRQSTYTNVSDVGYYVYQTRSSCFMVSDDCSFTKMLLRINKVNSPTDNLVARIETNFKDQFGCETNGYQNNSGNQWTSFGTNANQKLGMTFLGTQTVDVRYLYLQWNKSGSLSDGVTVRVETDNAGTPSGNLVDPNATATVLNAQVPSGSEYIVRFPEGFTLTSGTQYWIVLERTAALDDTNYYQIYTYSTGGSATKRLYKYNGSAWSQTGTNEQLYFWFNNCYYSNHQNRPSGKLVSTNHKATIVGSSLTAVSHAIEKLTFPTTISLSKNTLYRLVIERSGLESTTNYYQISYGGIGVNVSAYRNQVFHSKYLNSDNRRYGQDAQANYKLWYDFLGDYVPAKGALNLYRGTNGGAAVKSLTSSIIQLGGLYKGMTSSEYAGSFTSSTPLVYTPVFRPSVNGYLIINNTTADGTCSVEENPYLSQYSSGRTTTRALDGGTAGIIGGEIVPVYADTYYRINVTTGQVCNYRFVPMG